MTENKETMKLSRPTYDLPSTIQTKNSEKPWKEICCKRCFNALSDKAKCKCRCRGEHHGKGKQPTAEGSVESKVSVSFDT